MLKHQFYCWILLLVCLCGCSNKPGSNSLKQIDISIGFTQPLVEVQASTMIDSFKYVKLATNDSILIGGISKILYQDGFLFVLNEECDKVFIFNSDGSINQIVKRKGKGPGEYIYITDFCYYPNRKEVIILDHNSKKVVCYSLIDKTSQEHKIPTGLGKIYNYQDIFVFLIFSMYHNETWPYYLYTTDSDFQEIERLGKTNIFDEYPKREPRNSTFHHVNGNLVFWNRFGDTISYYKLTKGDSLKLVNQEVIVNYINPMPVDQLSNMLNYNHFFFSYYTDRTIIFMGNIKNKPVSIFYSVENDELVSSNLYKTHGIINNLDAGPSFFPIGQAGHNVLYNIIEPSDYLNKQNSVKNHTNSQVIYPFNSVQADDNPIIQLAFFKHE